MVSRNLESGIEPSYGRTRLGPGPGPGAWQKCMRSSMFNVDGN